VHGGVGEVAGDADTLFKTPSNLTLSVAVALRGRLSEAFQCLVLVGLDPDSLFETLAETHLRVGLVRAAVIGNGSREIDGSADAMLQTASEVELRTRVALVGRQPVELGGLFQVALLLEAAREVVLPELVPLTRSIPVILDRPINVVRLSKESAANLPEFVPLPGT
jgi:hypothetical protein